MKRIVIFVAFLVIALSAMAQWTYHPFAKEGKVFAGGEWTYKMEGDTIIGNNSYKRVFITEKGKETRYWGATRDEGMQVYMIKAGEIMEKLYYDFGKENKYVDTIGNRKVTIEECFFGATDGGDYRKVRWVFPEQGTGIITTEDYIWVDGIGNIGDPFNLISGWGCVDCYEDGVCVFNTDLIAQIFLNHATFIKAPSFSHSISKTIFDLQGRRITSIPSRGVYIMDGKKYVKK